MAQKQQSITESMFGLSIPTNPEFGGQMPVQRSNPSDFFGSVNEQIRATGRSGQAGLRRLFGQQTPQEATVQKTVEQEKDIREAILTFQASNPGIDMNTPEALKKLANHAVTINPDLRMFSIQLTQRADALQSTLAANQRKMKKEDADLAKVKAETDLKKYELANPKKEKFNAEEKYFTIIEKPLEKRTENENKFVAAFEQVAKSKKSDTTVSVINKPAAFKEANKIYKDAQDRIDKLFSVDAYQKNIEESVNIGTLQSLLDQGLQTGFGVAALTEIEKAFQSISSDFKLSTNASKAEVFQAISNLIVLPQVKQLGVNPTDADLNFIKASVANLGKTTKGNQALLAFSDLKNKRANVLLKGYRDWFVKHLQEIQNEPSKQGALSFLLSWEKEQQRLLETHPLLKDGGNNIEIKKLKQQVSEALSGNGGENTDKTILEDGGLIIK